MTDQQPSGNEPEVTVPAPKPLTVKQQRFAEEFLVDHNKTRAAVRAGYSEKSARKIGYELYQNPLIKARIQELMKEREDACRVKAYRALEELAIVAFSDVDDYLIDDLGRITPKDDAPQGATRAIAGVKLRIESQPNGVVTRHVDFRLHEKNPALTNALKHLGLLKDVVEHHDATLEDLIKAASEAADGDSRQS